MRGNIPPSTPQSLSSRRHATATWTELEKEWAAVRAIPVQIPDGEPNAAETAERPLTDSSADEPAAQAFSSLHVAEEQETPAAFVVAQEVATEPTSPEPETREPETRNLEITSGALTATRFAMLHNVARRWKRTSLPSRRYVFAVGSHVEARKLAPVIRALRLSQEDRPFLDEVLVCVTGEHPENIRETLEQQGIAVDWSVSIETSGHDLDATRARILNSFGKIFTEVRPEWLVVQGDSTMAAMASLAAYYANVRVAHVDGGTPLHDAGEWNESVPEVLHRRIASLFASIHFAETAWSKDCLIQEGVPEESILITGNTGVDALHESCAREGLPVGTLGSRSSGVVRVLIIMEQQSTFERLIPNVCRAVRNLAMSVPGLYQFVWPLHAEPWAMKTAHDLLAHVPGLLLTGPAKYEQFLRYLTECDLVLTDTPDVQEDAPSLGKPVLLIRESVQRPEALRAGVTILVGSDSVSIQSGVRNLARKLSSRHGSVTNPFGDGKASTRIFDFFEGRPVLEFGRTAHPRLHTTGESASTRRPAVAALG